MRAKQSLFSANLKHIYIMLSFIVCSYTWLHNPVLRNTIKNHTSANDAFTLIHLTVGSTATWHNVIHTSNLTNNRPLLLSSRFENAVTSY